MAYLEFLLGTVLLLFGIPIGNVLAKLTKEELKEGKNYFRLIIILSFIGTVFSLIFQNDPFLFSFAFIAIVTSRSLKK